MKEACSNNGLPEIKYKLEENTAKNFQETLCGAHIIKRNASSTPTTSKYYKDQTKKKRNFNHEEQAEENLEAASTKERKTRKILVNTQKGATALPLQHKTIHEPKSLTSNKTGKTTEDMLINLKKELEKYIIMIETEDNVEKTVTELRTLSLIQIWELLTSNNIINSTEWTQRIKNYVEKLLHNAEVNVKLKVKTQKVNIESIEISILRAAEQEKSFTAENIYLDESSESDVFDESEHSTIVSEADSIDRLLEELQPPKISSNRDLDDFLNSIIKPHSSEENKPVPATPIDRISSYPTDYYIRSGTFSE